MLLSAVALAVVLSPLMGLEVGRLKNPGGRSLRVATANVQSYTANQTLVGAQLAQLDADVLLLEEVWTVKHLEQLKAELPGFIFYQAGDSKGDYAHYGVFVATRLPVTSDSFRVFDHGLGLQATADFGTVFIVGLHGRKKFEYGPSDVVDTVSLQSSQAKEVLTAVSGRRFAIVGGDFNAPPSAPSLKLLRASLMDAFAAEGSGYGYTFPAGLPLLRIDQILCSPSLRPVHCWTVATGSDHLAVVADFVPAASH